MKDVADAARMAELVQIVGRGPGRSRPLTRDEAREAFLLILSGRADPHQIGAFLMLLRYRGESIAETAGFLDAARSSIATVTSFGSSVPALDWPSYSGGKTRRAPWFLLAALALASAGYPVLMHGAHEHSTSITPPEVLKALDYPLARDLAEGAALLRSQGFAYVPLAGFSPPLQKLMGLRDLFGLRSPVNTVVRLLNPLDAPASIDGVFHPAYIDVHLGVAATVRHRLLVLKGGGGEAERNPKKSCLAYLWDPHAEGDQRLEITLPPVDASDLEEPGAGTAIDQIVGLWRNGTGEGLQIVLATLALGLIAVGITRDPAEADHQAIEIWQKRRAEPFPVHPS